MSSSVNVSELNPPCWHMVIICWAPRTILKNRSTTSKRPVFVGALGCVREMRPNSMVSYHDRRVYPRSHGGSQPTKNKKPRILQMRTENTNWLVVDLPLWKIWKSIGQLGLLFPIYGKTKNVPNHQPTSHSQKERIWQTKMSIWPTVGIWTMSTMIDRNSRGFIMWWL